MPHHFGLDEPVFRAIRQKHLDEGSPWPPPATISAPARWNRDGQGAVYGSHEVDVAFAEKRRHLGQHADEILTALEIWSGQHVARFRLRIVSFAPLVQDPSATWDGRGETDVASTFEPFMRPGPPDGEPEGYEAAQQRAHGLIIDGYLRLVVPSYPFFAQDPRVIRWNSVMAIGAPGQAGWDALPTPTPVGRPFTVEIRAA